MNNSTATQIGAAVLPWMVKQRWFPSGWPTADWSEAYLHDLTASDDPSDIQAWILLCRPDPTFPWVQVPLTWGAADSDCAIGLWQGGALLDGINELSFWRAWMDGATLVGPLQSQLTVNSAQPLGREQSNSSAVLSLDVDGSGFQWIAKIFRIVYPGNHPEVELPLVLADSGWDHATTVRAYRYGPLPAASADFCSGVASLLLPGVADGFDYFRTLAQTARSGAAEARRLGRLVADMETSLHGASETAATKTSAKLLAKRLHDALDSTARSVAAFPDPLREQLGDWIDRHVTDDVTVDLRRIHGDLHLGQTLRDQSGKWYVIDFEGEPLRPLAERTTPDLPLRDVAGMLRSFDYAGESHPEWVQESRAAFLTGYRERLGRPFPESLLQILEVEKALYEVTYEAQFRPFRLPIPLSGLQRLVFEDNHYSNH